MTSSTLTINGETIPVRPDAAHEYVLETSLVAKGYGVVKNVIEQHKSRNGAELVEGKHWIKGVTNCQYPGGAQECVLWTKRGIIRLGFFIKSARAKLFRDAAEDLVIDAGKPATPSLSDAIALRAALLGYSEKVIALETKNAELTPKADALDLIATATDGSLCLRDAAKALQLRPIDLNQWLQSNKWIYRRAGNMGLLGYQDKVQQGVVEHKTATFQASDGQQKLSEQVRVTAKGLAALALIFAKQEVAS